MSRPIKFRAWDVEYQKWNDGLKILLDGRIRDFDFDDEGYYEFEVSKEAYVIEQCTGLTDKNGKEVYEGDVVKVGDIKPIFNVAYSVPCAKFWMVHNGIVEEFEDWNEETEIEVIGNIHENPELIGGKE